MTQQVLLIEDDDALRASLAQTIELAGWKPIPTNGFVQARRIIRTNFNGVILSDIRMPHQDGFDVLAHTRALDPELPVILLTGHSDVPTAMRAMKEGAWDYLEKPSSTERLEEVLRRALGHRALVQKSRLTERALIRSDPAALNFPGGGAVSKSFRVALRQIAATRQHVHLVGGAGSGKKLAAYTINQLATEPCPFVSVNFGKAAPDVLDRISVPDGPFDLSAKQIGEASTTQRYALQELLHRNADIRLITSSVLPLLSLVKQAFLDELAPSTEILEIVVPTLEDRRTDLPEIFAILLRQVVDSLDSDMPDVTEALIGEVLARRWPGNIPELRAFATSFALGQRLEPLPAQLSLAEQLDAFERTVLIETLKRTGGHASDAATLLGLPRNTFYDRLKRYDLSAKDYRGAGSV